MDNQDKQPPLHQQQPVQQVVATPAPGTAIPTPNHDPKPNISDKQALAILMINNLDSSHAAHAQPKRKVPVSLLITLATAVTIIIVAGAIVGSLKSHTNSKTSSSGSTAPSSSSSDTNSNSPTDQTNGQINQDVDSCSNPLTAISQC
jgi:hypothetical protein